MIALLRELLAEHQGSTFETQQEIVKALGPRIARRRAARGRRRRRCCQGSPSATTQRDVITDRKGNPEPDSELRDQENVPLPAVPVTFEEDPTERFATLEYRTAVEDYMRDEVLPYVPDAWVDHDKTKIGYEIPLTRHFYKYVPPRPLAEIDAEIRALEDEIQELLAEVARVSAALEASRRRLASAASPDAVDWRTDRVRRSAAHGRLRTTSGSRSLGATATTDDLPARASVRLLAAGDDRACSAGARRPRTPLAVIGRRGRIADLVAYHLRVSTATESPMAVLRWLCVAAVDAVDQHGASCDRRDVAIG